MSPTAQQLRARLDEAVLVDVGEGFWEVGFRALGSPCELFYAAANRDAAQHYRRAAFDWLAGFEAKFSRFIADSDLSAINARAGSWVDIDAQTELLLGMCDNYHIITHGAFDATSLPLSQLWDWKRKRDELPSADEIAAARQRIGWAKVERSPGKVRLPPGMCLDFGGVGKEFAADCLLQLAIAMGVPHAMVDLAGDIAVHGEPPEGGSWYIGLEDPANVDRCYCGIRLRGGAALATSGDYRRCFEFKGQVYGHIVDCRTGWPVANGTRSVSVIAPHCTNAGVLATSAMIIGGPAAIEMLERNPGVEGCLWSHGKLHVTKGFRRNVLPAGWDAD